MTKRILVGRAQLWTAVVGLMAPIAVLAAASPSNALPAGCVDVPGPEVVCTYGPGLASFEVPQGVNTLEIIAAGAAGGAGGRIQPGAPAAPGGRGAIVRRTQPVAAGQVLDLRIGAAGQPGTIDLGGAGGVSPLGIGGDGAAGPGGTGGGGGGGATSIQRNGNWLLVAGGGGGGGGGGGVFPGGAGGDAGQNGLAGSPGNPAGAPLGGAGGLSGAGAPVDGVDATPGPNPSFGGGGGGAGATPGGAGGSSPNQNFSGGGGGGGGSYGGNGPAAYSLNPNAQGRLEIRYTPCVGPSQVVLGNASVVEGNGGPGSTLLNFPITLSNPSCADTTVHLQAGGPGTAQLGSDYTVPSFAITIPAGTPTGNFTVLVNGDEEIERDEYLFARIVGITLDGASDGPPPPTFNPQPRVGIIRNDDGVILACVPGEPFPPGYNVIMGTNGDDDIHGTPGDDIIFGLRGDDRIVGGGGNDILCGGPGRDRLAGGAGDDQISGDDGDDILLGGDGNDTLVGGPGDDKIIGGAGVDTQTP